jgi:signal transduction histidine kinase
MFAHDTVLGVVTVVRSATRPPFGETEIRRIRALADQAALAIWKSRLLAGAQAANQAKNEFIAVMSHELRTPLAAVTGYEELLGDEILGPLNDEQHNAIDRMRWGTQLLASIIEEILTYSRLESGEVSARMEEISVEDVLRSTAAVLQPLAAARELELRVSVPASGLTLRTDAAILRRVLVNLGSNAIKFTREGEVQLAAAPSESMVSFSVRDSGIGIAPDDMERIFNAFTQVYTGIARPYGGSGLGLHTANRLVRLLGGELKAESELGVGSTFSVLLPAA